MFSFQMHTVPLLFSTKTKISIDFFTIYGLENDDIVKNQSKNHLTSGRPTTISQFQIAREIWIFKVVFWNCYQKWAWKFWMEFWMEQGSAENFGSL